MSEKKEKQKRADKLKDVAFDFSAPETREATITVNGFNSFTVTYRVPDGKSDLDTLALSARHQSGNKSKGLSETEGLGQLLLSYVASHLKKWSLEPAPTLKNIEALAKANHEVALALFNEINATDTAAKN